MAWHDALPKHVCMFWIGFKHCQTLSAKSASVSSHCHCSSVQMLVDDIGDVTITNDGATILKLLEVEHPAAKVSSCCKGAHCYSAMLTLPASCECCADLLTTTAVGLCRALLCVLLWGRHCNPSGLPTLRHASSCQAIAEVLVKQLCICSVTAGKPLEAGAMACQT